MKKKVSSLNSKKPKVVISQSKRFWTNYIIKPLIGAVFTASIAFVIWKIQHETDKTEKLINDKESAYNIFSNTSTKAINFSFSRDKLVIKEAIIFSYLADSIKKLNQDINDKINMTNIEITLQKKFPKLYEDYSRAIEFQGEFVSSCNSSKLLFNDQVDKKIDTLENLLGVKAIMHILGDNLDYKNGNYSKIDEDALSRITLHVRKNIQQDILSLMQKEINNN